MKKLLIYAIPFLLPFVLYGIYFLLAKRGIVRSWPAKQVAWLMAAGLGLSMLTAGFFAVTDGARPGTEYTPPRVENGEIKSSEFRKVE